MKDRLTNTMGAPRAGMGGSGGGRGGMSITKNRITTASAKRRIGSVGKASASVKTMANKDIKAARKASGEYPKSPYGRKSVNATKGQVPVKGRKYKAPGKK